MFAPDDVGDCADDPEIAWVPDHAPDAVHEVAFVDDHVTVDDFPRLTFGWLNASVTVGAGVVTAGGIDVAGVDVPPPHAVSASAINPAPIDFFIRFLHSHTVRLPFVKSRQ